MLRLCVVAALLIARASAWGGYQCSPGPVGTCAHLSCYPTRGPTQCQDASCMCMPGYCAVMGVHNRCRAAVGTCRMLPCNQLAHGGPLSTECVSGACLCHSGYHDDGNGVCTKGWWPESVLMEMNATEKSALMEMSEAVATAAEDEHVDPVWAFATFAAGWAMVVGLSFGVLLGVAAVARKVGGASAYQPIVAPEEALYERLAALEREPEQ
eukprot:TRINITY_DN26647_c0_g1_i1.p1 TRINITY_DN26647_c0_g1~~TRINITY_DN26647_c0_g1_i1.p1  ORF type:complete len:211 (-),score=35.23 TRINITY_DN26647_c0_g1_i1:85-717(-)